MTDLIAKLADSLRGASVGTRLVACLCLSGLVAVVGTAVIASIRTDPRPAFSGLDDHDLARVSKALTLEGIAFEVSAGGAPYTVSLDRHQRPAAFAAAYGSGALEKPLRGILSVDGKSAEEQTQSTRNREWSEMESMLETLDFVLRASVRTSAGQLSPIDRTPSPMTASVTVRTTGVVEHPQRETIARIVSLGLGVDRENLFVSDSRGNVLFDGSPQPENGLLAEDPRAVETAHDELLARRANGVLDRILGEGRAYVLVVSRWNYEKKSVRSEAPSGRSGVLLEETSMSLEKPASIVEASEEAAGAAFADSNSASGPITLSSAPPEKHDESTKKYVTPMTIEERISEVPVLERISVALYIDDSVAQEQVADIEAVVQASVGFDAERDSFQRATLTFQEPALVEEGAPAADPPADDTTFAAFLEHGVEIVLALAFAFLLLKSLKGSSTPLPSPTAPVEPQAEELDAELLARESIDEILRNDPDRAGEVLSSWARGEELTESRP